MVCYPAMLEPATPQLERSPTVPSLALHAEGLAPASDHRGLGGQHRRGQLMAEAGPRRRPGSPPTSPSTRYPSAVVCRATRPTTQPLALRARSLWLLWTGLDAGPSRCGYSAGVRRFVSSRACRPAAQSHPVEPTKASPAGSPVRRSRHCALAGGDLARPQKGAPAQGQSIFFIDESGFYPLPSIVRTYAPVGQTPVLRE